MDCSFLTSTFNFNDIVNCTLVNMGMPFDFMALGIFAAFIIFAAISRLDFDFSLACGIALTWGLMIISGPFGGSTMLQYLMGLLILGLGLRLLIALIAIFRQ